MKIRAYIGKTIFLAMLAGVSSSEAQTPDGLVGYWKLNQNPADYSGNNNHAVITYGGTAYSAYQPGSLGTGLDGSGKAYGLVGDTATLSALGSVTLEAWIRLNSYPVPVPGMPCYYGIPILSKAGPAGESDDEYSMVIDPGGQLVVHFAGRSGYEKYLSTQIIPLNRWTHVAAVLDTYNRITAMYINGVLDNSHATNVVADQDTNVPFYIGMLVGDCAGPRYFDGMIDEVRVWNRGLSHAEIQNNMYCELTGVAEELGGYAERRICRFSDRQWLIRPTTLLQPRPPGDNYWSHSRENVWVDGAGRMHLRLAYDGTTGRWNAAEVETAEPVGYGNYSFTLDTPVSISEPNAVLGLFASTRNDLSHAVSGCLPEGKPNEIDIEFSRWGLLSGFVWDILGQPTLGQHVVGPNCQKGGLGRSFLSNVVEATAGRRFWFPGRAPSRHSLVWMPEMVWLMSATQGLQGEEEATCIAQRGQVGRCPKGSPWGR